MDNRQKRLKRPEDFRRCYARGKMEKNSFGVIHYLDNELPFSRVGIAVSKKLGNAVIRNRIKRRIRAIVQNMSIYSGFDLVISARFQTKQASFEQLNRGITDLLSKGNLIPLLEKGKEKRS